MDIELFCIILNYFGENGNGGIFFIKNTVCIIIDNLQLSAMS